MRSSAFALLAVVFGVFLAVSPLPAHHSFSAEYDSKKPVTLKGTVSKVEWMNPHVYFYLADCEVNRAAMLSLQPRANRSP